MARNYIIASIIVLIIAVFGFFFFRNEDSFSNLPSLNFANIFNVGNPSASLPQAPAEGQEMTPDSAYTLSVPSDFKKITNYEEGFEITTYEKNNKEGFQIFVMPFDEPGPLTHERILIDLDIDMTSPALIDLDGIQAPIFNSKDENFGKTFEVWFIHGNKLYQIMTYAAYERQLLKILETWKFK